MQWLEPTWEGPFHKNIFWRETAVFCPTLWIWRAPYSYIDELCLTCQGTTALVHEVKRHVLCNALNDEHSSLFPWSPLRTAFCRSRTSLLPSGLTVPNHALKCRLLMAPLPEKTKVWNLDGVGAERTLSGKRLHNEMGRDANGWVEMRARDIFYTACILMKTYCCVKSWDRLPLDNSESK